jgi:hypothetical protein
MHYLQRIGVFMAKLVHLLHLLLALLEPSEVVLDKEGRVELAHRHIIISYGRITRTILEIQSSEMASLEEKPMD